MFDLNADDAHKESAVKELLAEDIRLLYVGLTRSVYRCYLGIGAYKKGRIKASPLVKSALGYLCIKAGDDLQAGDDQKLQDVLQSLCNTSDNIAIRRAPQASAETYHALTSNPEQWVAPQPFAGHIESNWWVTSYSALSRFHSAPSLEDKNTKKIQQTSVITPAMETLLVREVEAPVNNVFSFPRGAKHGTFLHELLEQVDFQRHQDSVLIPWLNERLNMNNYPQPELWAPIVSTWVGHILEHPLAATLYPALSLSQLSEQQKKVEMQFFIPMQAIDSSDINRLIAHYDPLSARAGLLQFNQVQGMLKGFIDLTFEYQGQYFVLDYKSNYLGDSLLDYSEQAMADAIIEHRYDFQYQLYTLALHRLLKSRLANYDYEQHIGGVFYTFLRGMQGEADTGCYFTKPKYELIDKLDKLLSGALTSEQLKKELIC